VLSNLYANPDSTNYVLKSIGVIARAAFGFKDFGINGYEKKLTLERYNVVASIHPIRDARNEDDYSSRCHNFWVINITSLDSQGLCIGKASFRMPLDAVPCSILDMILLNDKIRDCNGN
jgi:hypothetical protein